MIFDQINNWHLYLKHPIFQNVFSLILENRINFNSDNIYILEKDLFIKKVSYNTKIDDFITESHRKYVDIQIVLNGGEEILISSLNSLEVQSDYNEETDCTFYSSNQVIQKSHTHIKLLPGNMAVFFPQDAHTTQIAIHNKPEFINKLVIKAHEKFFI